MGKSRSTSFKRRRPNRKRYRKVSRWLRRRRQKKQKKEEVEKDKKKKNQVLED